MGKMGLRPVLIAFLIIAVTMVLILDPSLFTPKSDVGVSFVVAYSDGTKKTYEGTAPISLQVVDPATGRTINYIYCRIGITPTWVGAKSSSLVTGTITITNNGVTKYTESPTSPTLISGGEIKVWDKTIYNTELNTWAPTPGSYTFLVSASITTKITFTDGTSSSKTGAGSGQIVYSYSGG